MGYGRCVGRVGALAVATRMTVSIGVAVLVVMATVVRPVSPAVRLAASSAPCTHTDVTCALIMGTSGVPTPDDFYVESVKNQFIAPTHPGQHRVRQGDDARGVVAPRGAWSPRLAARARSGPRRFSGLAAQHGTCRGGTSRGSSTSPSISQSCTGSPIWSRRSPSTPTTIW